MPGEEFTSTIQPVFTRAQADALVASVAAVRAKTDALPDDLSAALDSIAGFAENLPSDPADASVIAAAFSVVNATLAIIAGYLDTEVSAIKSKTDNLPTLPADGATVSKKGTTVENANGNFNSGTGDAFSTATQLIASLAAESRFIHACGTATNPNNGATNYATVQIMQGGAGVETVIAAARVRIPAAVSIASGIQSWSIDIPIVLPSGTRISIRAATGDGSASSINYAVTLVEA